jgi:PST family polysaccharide transporter
MSGPDTTTETGPDSSRKVLSNSAATLVGRALNTLFRFLSTLVAARHLGPEAWGFFGILVSTTEAMRALANFGLDPALVRWLSVHHDSAGHIMRRVLWLKTILAAIAVAAIAGYGLVHFGANHSTLLLLALAATFVPFGWTQSLIPRFQAVHAMHQLIPVQVAVGGGYLAVMFGACELGIGVPGFVALAVAYEFVLFAATALTVRRKLPKVLTRAPATHSMWELFVEGLPLGFIVVATIIYGRTGIFFLEKANDLAQVGNLYLAMRITEQVGAVAGALAVSALPVFSRLAMERQIDRIRPQFRRFSLMGFAFSICVMLGVIFVSRPLIGILKPAYLPMYEPLVVLSFAAAFMVQNQLSSGLLYAFGQYRYVAACGAINLVVNVLLAWLLIPRYGATGAAFATVGTEGLNCVLQLLLVRYVFRGAQPLPAQAEEKLTSPALS